MCLTIYCKTRQESRTLKNSPLIAEKDIIVYKKFNFDLSSPYRFFQYEKGTHYYQVGKPFSFKIDSSMLTDRWKLMIHQGLHAYRTKQNLKNKLRIYYKEIGYRCIVPQGSKYFINDEEIVSDNLIIPYNPKEIK